MAFLAMTVLIAAAAWFFTGDPVRAVAVLVIATPCPLILAVPVAIVSGLSRAAGHGILIKGGKAIEALARINSLVLDKTGTLTDGRAKVVAVNVSANADPDDANQDGISGKPNQVWSRENNKVMLGRFGWKAGVPSINQQAGEAANGDIGLSTTMIRSASGECTGSV